VSNSNPLPAGPLKEVALEEFLALYDPVIRPLIRAKLAEKGVDAMVDFANLDLWSSQYADRTAVAVGPGKTFPTVESAEGQRIGETPSAFQYAIHYVRKPKEQS
jgi:hypothetical protein